MKAGAVTTVVAAVLACAAVAGCGDGGGRVATEDGTGATRSGLPADQAVLSAVAGDDEAWVLTQAGGEAASEVILATLWRVTPGGEATELTTMEGAGWWLETNGTDAFVVSSGCPDGESGCDPIAVARLWVASGAEVVVDGIEVGRTEEPGTDVAAHTVGTAGSDVWVGAADRLLRVAPDGEVVTDVARGEAGFVCAVDGRLIATTRPETPEAVPPTVAERTGSELDVVVLEDGGWTTVSRVALGPDEDLQCTPAGVERFSFAAPAVPVAFLAPGSDAFQPVATGDGLAVDPGSVPLVTKHGEVAVVGDDGQLLVRPPGTAAYEPRPSVRTVEGAAGYSIPIYDASPTVEVSCTPETGEEGSPVTCDVAAR